MTLNYIHLGTAMQYCSFGECRNSTGTIPTDKLFTGQRLDYTGLYYYNARYYDPTIGRFISADSIVPSPVNPQSLNRYAYCFNNPLKYTDPTGQIIEYIGDVNHPEYERALKSAFHDLLMSIAGGQLAHDLATDVNKLVRISIGNVEGEAIGRADYFGWLPDYENVIDIRLETWWDIQLLTATMGHEFVHASDLTWENAKQHSIQREMPAYHMNYDLYNEFGRSNPNWLGVLRGLDPKNIWDIQEAWETLIGVYPNEFSGIPLYYDERGRAVYPYYDTAGSDYFYALYGMGY